MPATGPPDWDADDTGAIPVGPEPEPTGAFGGGEGPGGWGGRPRVEPFAVAALVWAIVSVVLPLVGTIVALVLSARAADAIRRSQGTRGGTELVTAARVVAGVVIGLWAVGLVVVVALGGDRGDDGSDVAVPTQPSTTVTTTAPTTSTTRTPATTTTPPPGPTTTSGVPVVTVVPPTPSTDAPSPVPSTDAPQPSPPTDAPAPTEAPTTAPGPTSPPTTGPGPTAPTAPTTAPPPTTTPAERLEQRLANQLGESNRGVPAEQRVAVTYTPGETVTIRWAINNGSGALPTGEPTCTSPPPPPTTTTTTTTAPGATTTSTTTTSTTTTSTTTTTTTPTTTTLPADEPTRRRARQEARTILQVVRSEIRNGRIDVTGIQLVGTYPIAGPDVGDVDVVQVFYRPDDLEPTLPTAAHVFEAPPATEVQCLNPAFA